MKVSLDCQFGTLGHCGVRKELISRDVTCVWEGPHRLEWGVGGEQGNRWQPGKEVAATTMAPAALLCWDRRVRRQDSRQADQSLAGGRLGLGKLKGDASVSDGGQCSHLPR